MTQPPTDYDGAWKEALETYLQPFLELCFPAVAAGVDWMRPLEFLDKELQAIVRDAELGPQRADKLVKVHRRDGGPHWVLIHVEVQAQPDPALPRRMYRYHHRIADRYGHAVASLAVLGDGDPAWRPGPHREELWGCGLEFRYPCCKLLDFGAEALDAAAARNPAAVVIAAHLATQRTAGDAPGRLRARWELTRRLYERGYGKRDILELYRLLDWLLALPPAEAVEFHARLEHFEQEKAMPYVTTIERMGLEKGLEQGLEQGLEKGLEKGLEQGLERGLARGRHEGRLQSLREAILETLEARFGAVPYAVREQVAGVTDEACLKRWHRQAVLASGLEAFREATTARGCSGQG